MVRRTMAEGESVEVHIDTPPEGVERLDAKGLYKKARIGALKNFTDIDSPYEAPFAPELHIDTASMGAEQAAEAIVEAVVKA